MTAAETAVSVPAGRGWQLFIVATALICGALVMVIEVLGSRVIGPFFGVSLFVWSSLIAVTMIALAIGYAVGGHLSDKRAGAENLYRIIFAAGVLVLFIPLLKGWVLQICMPLGLRLGAFVASFLLFGPPLLLLGCVSPYVVRVAAREMRNLGRTVGGLYAVSTVGSVFGTLATGFVLIAYLRVSHIFYLVGALLIGLAVVYFAGFRRQLGSLALLLVPAAVWLLPTAELPRFTLDSGTRAEVVTALDSHYGHIKVVDYSFGEKRTRELLVDGTIQTGMDVVSGESVYPYPYLVSLIPFSLNPGGKRCLVLGAGGGVIPMWFERHGVSTDVVDIDPEILRLARDYFGFRISGRAVVEDARSFLAHETGLYDFMVMDIFSGEAAPAHVVSDEALRQARQRLSAQGVLAVNYIGEWGDGDLMSPALIRTLRTVFDQIEIYPAFDPAGGATIGNLVIMAYNGAPRPLPADLVGRYGVHPLARDEVQASLRWRFVPPVTTGMVLTDDYNPIDCLNNRVKEHIRQRVVEETDWRILVSS